MELALAHRPPTDQEVERLRLLLSAYQDGSGMLTLRGAATTLPGWRDFERAVAAALDGQAQESKAVFDVLLSDAARGVRYGISCKMRDTLREAERTAHVTIELSNSAGYFWTALAQRGIHQGNYSQYPAESGQIIVDLVQSWHAAVSLEHRGTVDLSKSCYLVLQWDSKSLRYCLFQYPLQLPAAGSLQWQTAGRRLIGSDHLGAKLFEWYGESGGQLKYYPYCRDAAWTSQVFTLEPLPHDEYGLRRKAAMYFPQQWARATADKD